MSETAHTESKQDGFCRYCGARLALGYYYACHVCGDSYCYIHMVRHARAHVTPRIGERLYAA